MSRENYVEPVGDGEPATGGVLCTHEAPCGGPSHRALTWVFTARRLPSARGDVVTPGSRSPPTPSDANVARSVDPLDDESHVVAGGHADQQLDQSVGDDLNRLASVGDRGIGETA